MSGVLDALRKLFGAASGQVEPDEPDPEMAYVLYWMKTARGWSDARRGQVRAAALEVVDGDGFTANIFERRYQVAGLDDSRHAGASLIALLKVLNGLEAFQQTNEESA
jgi:hypothetical protein